MGLLDNTEDIMESIKAKEPLEDNTAVTKNVEAEEPIVDADIDLSAIRKKRFRIDGDNSRILELNTSDFGVVVRLKETYPELTDLATQVGKTGFEFNEDDDEFTKLDKAGSIIDTIDKQMREKIDYIFGSNVSEVCAPDGTMYDLINGKFRFEYILERIAALYNGQIKKEYSKMASRLKKHTGKYHK